MQTFKGPAYLVPVLAVHGEHEDVVCACDICADVTYSVPSSSQHDPPIQQLLYNCSCLLSHSPSSPSLKLTYLYVCMALNLKKSSPLDLVNISKNERMNGVFHRLAGLLLGISRS